MELPSSARKNSAASEMLCGRSANAPGELQIWVSNRNLFFTYFLYIIKALPAAIFLASWISWRAPWASTRASCVLWWALASSDSWTAILRSKDSHFFLYGVLELPLDLPAPCLGLFLCCSLLGLGQRVLEGLHLGRSSYEVSC